MDWDVKNYTRQKHQERSTQPVFQRHRRAWSFKNIKSLKSYYLLSPRFFFLKKSVGDIASPPSVRPSVRLLSIRPSVTLSPSKLNHLMKSNQIWYVSCSHEWGAQQHIFGSVPWGPGEGPKGQISLNII